MSTVKEVLETAKVTFDETVQRLVEMIHPLGERTSEPCMKCTGWCCIRFNLKLLTDKRGRPLLEETLKTFDAPAEEMAFMKRNFRKVRKCSTLSASISDEERAKGIQAFTFECRARDPVTGKCTEYESRPGLCRRYMCGSAVRGKVPGPGVPGTNCEWRVQKRVIDRKAKRK